LNFFYCSLAFILLSCANDSVKKVDGQNRVPKEISKEPLKKVSIQIDSAQHVVFLSDVQTVNNNIQVELKYATTDNFMKIKLYQRMTNAFLQNDVAIRLGKCQDYLETMHPNWHLLVYDAVRPLSVQKQMWKALDTIPVKDRVKFVSNPANKSIHNYGAAVDLTIADENGLPIDMGAAYDDINKIAYPSLETEFLLKGLLSQKQIDNRKLLRKVMSQYGFSGIETEWWHFNACTRSKAARKYKVLEEELY
jgi:zinc D-Ala-D-Ala dipeptidase